MPSTKGRHAKPRMLARQAPGGERYNKVRTRLKTLDLHTVCESAHCPNRAECWGGGTATVMILGDVCTRACRFCAVSTGNPRGVVDEGEPERVALALADLGLDYIVLTSVDRDDMEDGGAMHFARTVDAIRKALPDAKIELLIPDFAGSREALRTVMQSAPDVLAHNVEVVRRLTPIARDRRASFDRSLEVLRMASELSPGVLTKSSLMVGLGETDEEMYEALKDLRGAGVQIITIGQYLQPSPKHLSVERYLRPEEFRRWEEICREMGFAYVASGALVRSSYRAGELFIKKILE